MLMSSQYNSPELCLKTKVPLFVDYGQFYYFLLSPQCFLFVSYIKLKYKLLLINLNVV